MSGRCRVRDLGLQTGLLVPGPLNSITDVHGVCVGHSTLIQGADVRTGVTAVLPHADNIFESKVLAAVHTLNGYGKAMGFEQVREVGTLEAPVLLCSTLEVGRVADAVVDWLLERNPELGRGAGTCNPLVAECFDGYLSNARRRVVQHHHVAAAIASAQPGVVSEGNIGAGTGMSGFEFKGGIGTSSRRVEMGNYTMGALVVLNCGRRPQLQIAGVPVGRLLEGWATGAAEPTGGSIIMVLATDTPLSARQLARVARRAPLGMARIGAVATHRSGDFVVAFSTAQRVPHAEGQDSRQLSVLPEDGPAINSLFQAAVEATEEAILNALCMAETMTGRDAHVRHALPLAELVELLAAHGHSGLSLPA